jgi:hypothetical protein
MYMGGVYDEINLDEIKIDTGIDMSSLIDMPKKVAESPRMLNTAPSFDIVGQRMYLVSQKGLNKCPKRVNVGVTQMGITVFDVKDLPVQNILFQQIESWAPDKKMKGVNVLKKPKGSVYFQTIECEAMCADLERNKKSLMQQQEVIKTVGSGVTPDAAAAANNALAPSQPSPPAGWEMRESSNYVRPPHSCLRLRLLVRMCR